MKKTILVLENNGNEIQWGENNEIEKVRTYKDGTLLTKTIRRFDPLVGLSLNKDWIKSISDYELIVLPDALATNSLLSWIKSHAGKNQRLILFCNNRLQTIRNVSVFKARDLGFEIWSYDKNDCLEHGFKHFNQFLNREFYRKSSLETEYDAVFVGAKKDRGELILRIKDKMDKTGLKTWFYVTDMDELPGNMCRDHKQISYEQYVSIIGKSRAVVDIVSDTNYGLTWRPVEALFMKKKLITNCSSISEMTLYCKDNVYIIGSDDRDLKLFLSSDYTEIDDEIVSKYDVSGFIRTLIE